MGATKAFNFNNQVKYSGFGLYEPGKSAIPFGTKQVETLAKITISCSLCFRRLRRGARWLFVTMVLKPFLNLGD